MMLLIFKPGRRQTAIEPAAQSQKVSLRCFGIDFRQHLPYPRGEGFAIVRFTAIAKASGVLVAIRDIEDIHQ